MRPMSVMSAVAGITALGALPNAAIPAGKLSTPAPTIDFTRLKTSLGIEAVPPVLFDASIASTAAALDDMANAILPLGRCFCDDGDDADAADDDHGRVDVATRGNGNRAGEDDD